DNRRSACCVGHSKKKSAQGRQSRVECLLCFLCLCGKQFLRNFARFLSQEIHQDELAERHGVCKIRLASADLRHSLHELDESAVAREHERVDHDAGTSAVRHFFECLTDYSQVESHRILIDVTVRHRQRARLAVGYHDDLSHVFLLAEENASRKF